MSATAVFLDEVAGVRPVTETLARYDQWAATFEQDVQSGGVSGPPATCKFISSLGLKKDAAILDAGAGTGRLGRLLKAEGFNNLYALDGSAEMLKMALKDNSYKSYTQGILDEGHQTCFPDNKFDAVVMVGVFKPGHFGVGVLPELIRIVKPGGVICWGQRDPNLYASLSDAFKDDCFHKAVVNICNQNNCTLEQGPVPLPYYYKDYEGYGYVLRKK